MKLYQATSILYQTVNNITKWNQVQEELSTGIAPAPAPAPVAVAVAPAASKVVAKERTATPEAEAEFEFSNTKSLTCLLCARQFKSLDQLKRHNKESELHKVCTPTYCVSCVR